MWVFIIHFTWVLKILGDSYEGMYSCWWWNYTVYIHCIVHIDTTDLFLVYLNTNQILPKTIYHISIYKRMFLPLWCLSFHESLNAPAFLRHWWLRRVLFSHIAFCFYTHPLHNCVALQIFGRQITLGRWPSYLKWDPEQTRIFVWFTILLTVFIRP